ncbi:WbqC-like protein family protein [Flavobacteriaceae bacterium MAR_2010_188]|nr:WbqC-like protein family protein [Flavobacteriaceae bacterium MAR_2010_188]
MELLLHPVYLPNLEHFSVMVQTDKIVFEAFDNFLKQTYRNRTYIYGANGKLQLNIPVRHSQKDRKFYRDVEIAYDTDWQLIHKRSIESAYSTSPFFEFYLDEILPMYSKPEKYLYDFNLRTIEIFFDAMRVSFDYSKSTDYEIKPQDKADMRNLADAKRKDEQQFENYSQVFNDKHGFINNLSILDLLCNLGPNTADYLKRQSLI